MKRVRAPNVEVGGFDRQYLILLFRCAHPRLTAVFGAYSEFTRFAREYVVGLDCGSHFAYDYQDEDGGAD